MRADKKRVQDAATREPTAGACFPLVRMARDMFLDFVILCIFEQLTPSLIEATPDFLEGALQDAVCLQDRGTGL